MFLKTEQVSNVMFYAQSTVTVILGCYTFCLYTVIVKKYVHAKIGIYSDF